LPLAFYESFHPNSWARTFFGCVILGVRNGT
jgi:hypothetical protein